MIKIIKFGGTIINNDKYLKNIYKIIDNELNDNNKLIIVVSAMGRDEEPYSTSKFAKLGSNLNEIDLAELLSYGERISSLVFLNSLISKNYKASVIRFEELGINLKGDYLKGELDYLENKKISDKLKDNNILIVPGFIGINNNKIGLLGKGGSDLTALYLAKMLNVKEIYLYKDVNGLMSGDPKVIVDCKTIEELSYDEALKDAQKCGIAENNPSLDVEGYDTACKIAILANVLLEADITLQDIRIKGIEKVKIDELKKIKESGQKLKLIGRADIHNNKIIAYVKPMIINSDHPLFSVDYKNKGVFFKTDTLGDISIIGGASGTINAAASIIRDLCQLKIND